MTAFTLQARNRLSQAPLLVLALALAVALAVSLPPVYLVVRASEGGEAVWRDLTAATTLRALLRTVQLTASVTLTCVCLAVPLAWLTARTDLPLRGFWTVVLALPLAIPSFVGGFIVVSALGPRGLLQELLEPLGVQRLPSIYGFWGAWLTLSFVTYPYIYLQVRAALNRVDPALEEAARSLGKSPLETFLRVNLPQLRPATAAGAILVALYVLSEFGAVAMLRYDTLTPLVYIQYATRFDRSAAAVLGLPLIGLAILIVLLDGLTRGRARYHAGSQRRVPKTLRLNAWRWPAFAYCSLVAAIGLGLPLAVIVYWLVRGLMEQGTTGFLAEAMLNSARASAIAALLAIGGALPLAILSARYPGWLSGALEKVAYLGQALPGITIALALVFFAANYVAPLYQTLVLLIFAYAVRFLPEALGACRSSLLQVNPHTEEAARSLGAAPPRVFLRVTAPQILPGLSAGALLVFLTAMKELPITLLLSPIGFDTLATQIWSASSEAFFTRAAVPALVLVGLSAVAVFLMLRREARER